MRFRSAAVLLIGLVSAAALGASLGAVDWTTRSAGALAESMCHAEYGTHLFNAAPETVGAVRRAYLFPGGPRPTSRALAKKARMFAALGLTPAQPMAWCWVLRGTDTFKAFALAAGHKPLFVQGVGAPPAPRPGPWGGG